MKLYKDKIRKILKSKIDLKYFIRSTQVDKKSMHKKLFTKIINDLTKIEERRDFMIDEIGMDMTLYEDQFFSVIENLFKLAFNQDQLSLIQMYLYRLAPDKEWDGTITVEHDEEKKTVKFRTPEDVWNVIKDIK